jgi:hypothetical protein
MESRRDAVIEQHCNTAIGNLVRNNHQPMMALLSGNLQQRDQITRMYDLEVRAKNEALVQLQLAVRFTSEHETGKDWSLPVRSFDVVATKLLVLAWTHLHMPILADYGEEFTKGCGQKYIGTRRSCHVDELRLAAHLRRHPFQFIEDDFKAHLQGAAELHWIATGRDVSQPLIEYRLEEHAGSCGTIALMLMDLPQNGPKEHSPHVFVAIGKLEHATSNQSTAVKEFRCPFAGYRIDSDVAGTRTHCGTNQGTQLVDTALQLDA